MRSVDALVCLSPGKLQVEPRPPPSLKEGYVVVRPRRIGICGTDFHIFEGKHPYLQYPRVMGHELAVDVVEAGSGSAAVPKGTCIVNPYLACGHCGPCSLGRSNCCERLSVLGVHQDGGMSELLSLPMQNLVQADGLSPDECAAVEFLAIGAHAVGRAKVGNHDKVLVVGAGPIGLGTALFARLAGAHVAMFDLDEDRAGIARSIARVNNVASDDASGQPPLESFDVVFDATGSQSAMEKSFDFVAHGGRYVLVGVIRNSIKFQDADFHRREMTLLASRNATAKDFEHVISSIRGGEVAVDRLITHRTTLTDAVRDIPRWASDKSGLIKSMIEID